MRRKLFKSAVFGLGISVISILSITAVGCVTSAEESQNQTTAQSEGEAKVETKCMGIDVSHHQKNIDWEKVAQAHGDSIKFVYVKATERATHKDANYDKNISQAREAGFKVGAYHYFRMTSSAEDQFENFKSNVKPGDIDLLPMVDVERDDGKSRDSLQKSLDKFIKLVETHYGCPVVIYGTQRSYNTYYAPEFNDHLLMIGRYGPEAPQIKGNGKYAIWQYSQTGELQGIQKHVDLNIIHQDKSLQDFCFPTD